MNRSISLLRAIASIGVILVWGCLATSESLLADDHLQDIKASLFREANQALQEARKAQADILAPKNFREGMKFYQEAEQDFDRGKNLEDIKKKLRAAVTYFRKALEATKLAEVTFSTALKARSDAENAGAPNFAGELWQRAEKKFEEAARKLEDGDVNGAKKRAGDAAMIYKDAELEAIKVNYLKETWDLLAQAKKMDVKDNAPKTIRRAEELIQQAEKELNENRYDTDVARNLAQQAKYEAKHAIYLHNTIRKIKREKRSLEEVLLQTELPLQQIAAAMDVVAEFDEGPEKPTQTIVRYIQTYQDSVSHLSQELADREQQITDLNARIAELEEQLGAVAQQQSELQKRMEAQARIREQFRTVEKMFDRTEARVFREGNDVILRLVGLNFASGSSVIQPQYFSLLTKVQQAIRTFPGCRVTIEGHTDSFGSDELNLKLSQERAEAVRQYLIANMSDLTADKIEAVGYGESRPIANNETPEGRAKNRRIDLVIHPELFGAN